MSVVARSSTCPLALYMSSLYLPYYLLLLLSNLALGYYSCSVVRSRLYIIYICHTLIVRGQLGMCGICMQLLGHVHSHVVLKCRLLKWRRSNWSVIKRKWSRSSRSVIKRKWSRSSRSVIMLERENGNKGTLPLKRVRHFVYFKLILWTLCDLQFKSSPAPNSISPAILLREAYSVNTYS